MTDDTTGANRNPSGIDDWLDASGFVDAELDIGDWAEVGAGVAGADTADDPWADVSIDVPTLTDAQREFLLGADELAVADAEIIDIPDDIDDIDPFHPGAP